MTADLRVFLDNDPLTDKVYRVFDPVKKIEERVSNVEIEDRMDAGEQVYFLCHLQSTTKLPNCFLMKHRLWSRQIKRRII